MGRTLFRARRWGWALVMLLLMNGCGREESPPPAAETASTNSPAALDHETVLALTASIDALREEVAALRGQMELEAQERAAEVANMPADSTRPDAEAFDPFDRERFLPREFGQHFDAAALRKITLDDDPSREQVAKYIHEIMNVTQRQNMFSGSDPQRDMLAKVGPEHVDLLIEQLRENSMGDMYLMGALGELVSEIHKDLICELLPEVPDLWEFVESHNWVDDAKPILTAYLQDHPPAASTGLIREVASFGDPQTYDSLLWQLVHNNHPVSVYSAIRDAPGIDLEDAVNEMWLRHSNPANQQARFPGMRIGNDLDDIAVIAASHGHLPALDHFIEQMRRKNEQELGRNDPREQLGRIPFAGEWFDKLSWRGQTRSNAEMFRILLDYDGPRQEMIDWYDEHRNELMFDRKKNKWAVSGTPIS